jgi:hypothetical protein
MEAVKLRPLTKSRGLFELESGGIIPGIAWRRHFGRNCYNVHAYDDGKYGKLLNSFATEKQLLAWINT